MGWLSGWLYRKSIPLSRASGSVTDYQMKLLLGESSGASGEDVDCGGKCLSSFNDIRFTTSDGETLLDYHIEEITGTTPNQLAVVWIEFDSIGTSETTFYMYYGNSGANAVSNGNATFVLFDDFAGSSLDTDKWYEEGSGGVTVNDGLTIDATYPSGWRGIRSNSVFGSGYALYSPITPTGDLGLNGTVFFGFVKNGESFATGYQTIDKTTPTRVGHGEGGGDWNIYVEACSSSTVSTTTHSAMWDSGDEDYHIIYRTASSVIGDVDGEQDTVSTNIPSDNLEVFLACHDDRSWYGSIQLTLPYVFVRKYAPVEPSWGSWGSEEEYVAPSASRQHFHIISESKSIKPVLKTRVIS